MKLVMKCKSEKMEFMYVLSKLQNRRDDLKKINITDYHTLEERREIDRWVKKAKEKIKAKWEGNSSGKQDMPRTVV